MTKKVWFLEIVGEPPRMFYQSSSTLSEETMWKSLEGASTNGFVPLKVANPHSDWPAIEMRGATYYGVPLKDIARIFSCTDEHRIFLSDDIKGSTSER